MELIMHCYFRALRCRRAGPGVLRNGISASGPTLRGGGYKIPTVCVRKDLRPFFRAICALFFRGVSKKIRTQKYGTE
jgi:hypothetical protein